MFIISLFRWCMTPTYIYVMIPLQNAICNGGHFNQTKNIKILTTSYYGIFQIFYNNNYLKI